MCVCVCVCNNNAVSLLCNNVFGSQTVAAMDVLVPKVGEIIGGSQREENASVLRARMAEMHVLEEPLKWYMDLREYGTVPHAGE